MVTFNLPFRYLKSVVTTPLVLALLDFSKSSVIECDASGDGVEAILMQESRPLPYLIQPLACPNKQPSLVVLRDLKLALASLVHLVYLLHRIGQVAYRLDLPLDFNIHLVFHICCSKKKLNNCNVAVPTLPPVDLVGELSLS